MLLRIVTARLVFSATWFGFYVLRMVYQKELPFLLDESPHIPAIATITFIGLGIITAMGVTGDRVEAAPWPWPFLWLWMVFAAITTLFYVALLLVYFFHLKRAAPPEAEPPTRSDYTMERQMSLASSFCLSKPVPALPKQPGSRPLSRETVALQREFPKSQSTSIITNAECSVGIEEPVSDVSGTGTKLDSALTETRQSRYSLASESFRPAPASRASLDTVKLLPPIGPACLSTTHFPRHSRHGQLLGPEYARPLPLPSSDYLNVEQEEEGGNPSKQRSPQGEHVANPPRSNNNLKLAPKGPLSSNGTHPPSSFTFSGGSQPSISRSPTAISNSIAAPAYSAGPDRERRDTLASNQTYETLPSYHSRRSTQALTDMTISSTPHTIVSLPPLPALPPFAPPLVSFICDSPVCSPGTSQRKHIISGESEQTEQ
ncbi:hypothetical protein PQX77_008703 [Marasmius sp. AFHP31]|nr:hypothetical protein PQX77_008703 [Marasmius sp. AFHP31]